MTHAQPDGTLREAVVQPDQAPAKPPKYRAPEVRRSYFMLIIK